MDPEHCVQMNMAIYPEEFLRFHPTAKHLFTEDLDNKAPTHLKNNCQNNFNRHVYDVEEFMELAAEDKEAGLGTHSTQKGAATKARRSGGLADEIEIRVLANQTSPFSPSPTLNLIHERDLRRTDIATSISS